ncbi:hypothetical protein NM688_g3137 [Phlebia brevispora]|uniref:Uncharacterized protein n=1 Tax=Phlebia brevispora TaxID=194682 RepID=A0ACC1T7B0_9APHY|nr:hypothetical protein NM688_g3137 [Phlebia brevispora]
METVETAMEIMKACVRLRERTPKRVATEECKKIVAELLKIKGNDHYKHGRFEDAVKCYEDAIIKYSPKAIYLNNLTAALLKLERYEEAEATTSQALRRNHKLMKARFRRGVARKHMGNYLSAIIDFKNVLKQDPDCVEARTHLQEIRDLCRSAEYSDNTPENLAKKARPLFDDPDDGIETGYTSDSSDFFHTGNGTPCRFYNHDGCAQGSLCRFKHAPDYLSVRDIVGRNVCTFYLLGLCPHTEATCHYAHDKTFLQPMALDNSERMAAERRAAQSCLEGRSPITLEGHLKLLNLNELGPMCIPRLRKETFDANRRPELHKDSCSRSLDNDLDVNEVPDWDAN